MIKQMKLLKKFLNHFFTDIKLVASSDFIFNCVTFLYCKYHKVRLKRSESYIGFPDWIKTKKSTTNPINDDD